MINPGCAVIRRDRTAIRRATASRPVRVAIDDGLIGAQTSVFDYGCGHGHDLRYLRELDVACCGWDPVFAPENPKTSADVVNLAYVVNVIEDPDERVRVLKDAWGLAQRVLVVAARLFLDAELPVRGTCFGDGFLTSRGTFQKLFDQDELRHWIDDVLEVPSVAAAPGIFYVFRDPAARESYSASRFSRTASIPKVLWSEVVLERYRPEFDELSKFVASRGRLPEADECPAAATLSNNLGGLKRAFLVLRRVTNGAQWDDVREARLQDLLVYLALSRFPRRCKFSDLSRALALDVKAFFTTYSRACEQADTLLFSAGNRAVIDEACRLANIGKLTADALYVHETAVAELPAVLRVYEGCARVLIGRVEGSNVLKLYRTKPAISYLSYPEFDAIAHPVLHGSLKVDLQSLRVKYRDYTSSSNRPILHRKEQFVLPSYPLREKFARLTAQEERHGLFQVPDAIGYETKWQETLNTHHLRIVGHRLMRAAERKDSAIGNDSA